MNDMAPPFRLYDFVAYIFPGVASVHVMYASNPDLRAASAGILTADTAFNYTVLIVVCYAVGLFWSATSRDLLRRLCWIFYNPRIELLAPRKGRRSALNPRLRAMVRVEVGKLLQSADVDVLSMPGVCRSYVAQNCPAAW